MKKLFGVIMTILLCASSVHAQNDSIYQGKVINEENDIYIVMDLYKKNITIKGQEFMGEMAGYIGDNKDFRRWLILDAEIIEPGKAILEISNDEGSEDLTAELTYKKDGNFILKQLEGSNLKIARNRKWKKLPKVIEFTVKNK